MKSIISAQELYLWDNIFPQVTTQKKAAYRACASYKEIDALMELHTENPTCVLVQYLTHQSSYADRFNALAEFDL